MNLNVLIWVSNWLIVENARVSGKSYVTVNPEIESVSAAPLSSKDHIVIPFTIENEGTHYLYGRLDCPTADDDSYWLKIDDGSFIMVNGLTTSGWEWLRMTSTTLTAGEHVLTIAYRENGANLDKISVSTSSIAPTGLGEEAENSCIVEIEDEDELIQSYRMEQNYPNPFNPVTIISYQIPKEDHVKVIIYDLLGRELDVIMNEVQSAGRHSVKWNANDFGSGIYFYKIESGNFLQTKKMILIK